MGWFRRVAANAGSEDFLSFGTSTDFYGLGEEGNTGLFGLWNSSVSVTGTAIALGDWNHAAVVVAGTGTNQAKAYLNGVLDITNNGSTQPTATTLMVGNSSGSDWLDGRAAAIKIWDVALSAEEVAQEANSILPVRFANLNGFYPCFPGATERLVDYSGNGRDWTANGSLVDEDPPPVSWGGPVQLFPFVAPAAGASMPHPWDRTMPFVFQ